MLEARKNRNVGAPPEPLILPHPDDIIFDDELGCRIVGPIDEEELGKCHETARLRDLLIMQHALDERRCPHADGESGAFLMAVALDRTLPKRMRLDDMGWWRQTFRSEAMTIRELLKATYSGWHALGRPRPRGARFGSVEETRSLLELIGDLHHGWSSGRLDLDAAARGEFDHEMQHIMANRGIAG